MAVYQDKLDQFKKKIAECSESVEILPKLELIQIFLQDMCDKVCTTIFLLI